MRRGLKSQKADLRTFLAEHRAVVTPAMAGLPANGLPRRVPGLRRDEIARLLGVATDYYTDLEKGLLPSGPEPSLQDLLSDVLALSPADRQRLNLLLSAAYPDAGAATDQQAVVAPPVQQASPSGAGRMSGHGGAVSAPTRQLLDSFDMPAYLRSRSLDLVAVNRPARLLYAPVLEWAGTQKKAVNLLEFAFFDQEAAQSFWPDWGDVITRAVADLRGALQDYPDDPDLIGVVGTLSARSRLFCRLWIDQDLPPRSSQGEERIFHSLIGDVTVPFRMLAEDDGAQVVVITPATGSPAHEAMQRLRAWAAAG